MGKKGSLVVLSTPNIANLAIRLSLFLGNFDYSERGILDRTHLRFFTFKSLKKMLDDADLEILTVRTTPIPLPELIPALKNSKTGAFLGFLIDKMTFVWKTLFAYQFVILAYKK